MDFMIAGFDMVSMTGIAVMAKSIYVCMVLKKAWLYKAETPKRRTGGWLGDLVGDFTEHIPGLSPVYPLYGYISVIYSQDTGWCVLHWTKMHFTDNKKNLW